MKFKTIAVLGLLSLLVGCESPGNTLRDFARGFYPGSDILVSREEHGFRVKCPDTWGLITEERFDENTRDTGIQIAIIGYKWSPVIQFNKLATDVNWEKDMTRLDADLRGRQQLEKISNAEALTSY